MDTNEKKLSPLAQIQAEVTASGAALILVPASVIAKIARIYRAVNASEFAITGHEKPLTDSFVLSMLESKVDATLDQKAEAARKKQLVRIGELQAKGYSFQKACEAVGMTVPKESAVQPVQVAKQ